MTGKTYPFIHWSVIVGIIAMFSAAAQAQSNRQQPRQLTISEDILTIFVDQPCYHFEKARDKVLTRDARGAANHLRVGAAFLKLQSARATVEGRKALDASIRELERLAFEIEAEKFPKIEKLQQAFANAHYAMSGHHCISSAHRCCQPSSASDQKEMERVGHDLKAAAVHLKRGLQWSGKDSNPDVQKNLRDALEAADRLIIEPPTSQSKAMEVIGAFRQRFENTTGRKIMIAEPPSGFGVTPVSFPRLRRR